MDFTPGVSSNNSLALAREYWGYAECPGSCGELVQGTWLGTNFLVPCPVELYSRAWVKLVPGTPLSGAPGRTKALQAVKKTLEFFGVSELGGELEIQSEIPQGKGMASSTADIGAAIGATASALNRVLEPRQILDLALSIEPTDGTVLPGITLVDHLKGRWQLSLGRRIPAGLLILDTGGEIDTQEFNRRTDLAEKNLINEQLTREAFYLVRRGIQGRDLEALGQGTTLSALANQSILSKDLLDEIIRFGQLRGAKGVIAAHSGTVLGLIYSQQCNLQVEEKVLRNCFSEIRNCWQTELSSGGVKVVATDGCPRRKFAEGQG